MARKVVPESRMSSCMYALAYQRHAQVVLGSDGTAGLAGVMRCGLRGCPNCAAILADGDFRRALHVAGAWNERGSLIGMFTFTMSHKALEPLAALRQAFGQALESLYRSRRYQAFKTRHGLTGNRFYGNEVTDGANGWHLHRHECDEFRPEHMPETRQERRELARQLERELTPLWLHELKRQGRTGLAGIAVKVTLAGRHEDPEQAATYVTKMALETTYSPAKQGRRGGRSPWELLDDAGDKTLSEAQRARARARYREFVVATKGMHWTWFSDGCEVGPNPDEEPWYDDPGVPVLDISDFEWRCLRTEPLRVCWLLELVEEQGAAAAGDELRRWCDTLRWTRRFKRRESWEETAGGELMDQAAF
jgi:hypothetical protein